MTACMTGTVFAGFERKLMHHLQRQTFNLPRSDCYEFLFKNRMSYEEYIGLNRRYCQELKEQKTVENNCDVLIFVPPCPINIYYLSEPITKISKEVMYMSANIETQFYTRQKALARPGNLRGGSSRLPGGPDARRA